MPRITRDDSSTATLLSQHKLSIAN